MINPAENAYKFPLLIKSLFDYCTTLNPDNEIIYRDVSRYNYREFKKRVCKYANMIKNLHLDGGETIAVMDYDSHRYLESYFAVPMTGNVLHMINWRLSSDQILYTINHAEDLVIIAHIDFLPVLEHFAGSIPSLKYLIICKDDDSTEIHSDALHIHGEYEELMAQASDEYDFEDFDEDAVATLFYSTGTTGDPKGVYFTHRQLVLHTYNLATTLGFSSSIACRMHSNDVYLPLTPMFHVHAWGFPFLATAFSLKQVYPGKFTPEVFLSLFKKEKPTLSHCVPTILQMILNSNDTDLDLSGWKVIIGGAPMTQKLAKQALEKGIDVVVGYGMSETCPIIALTHIDPKFKDIDIDLQAELRIRTGVPPFLVDIKIIDDDGQIIKQDDKEQGEITVRAPWLTQGYYKETKRGIELWEGGYLHTGDIATMNTYNSMKITDRIKDVIKSGGEWISSIQLEDIINSHEAVAEVAVIGVPDEKWSERPFALISLKPNTNLTENEVKSFLEKFAQSNTISKWAIPQSIEFVNEIPKTSVGKLNKKLIRSRYLEKV